MAELRYPASDRNRLALLEKCSKEATRDRLATAPYLVANLETAVDTFIAAYRPAIKLVQELRGQRGLEVDEKQTAVDELDRYVRDFWAVLERRIVRENLPRGLFIEYNQLRSGENATSRRLRDLLQYADDIVEGEARVVLKGFTPMSNPTAAEIAAKRDAAIAEAEDVDDVVSTLDRAQHAADALRPEADKLIRVVSAQFDASLYGMSADDVRSIKMRYGYDYYDRETAVTPEPVDPIAPEEEPAA